MTKVKPIPDGYHTATPYMVIKDAAKAIEFYKKAFGATEILCMKAPDGKVKHAEIKIGNSPIMITDEHPEQQMRGPQALGGSPMHLYLYVEDVDALFNNAVAAGAKVIYPIATHFYGDRSGGLTDPFGHAWFIATHVEDVPPAELKKRAEEAMKNPCSHSL